MFTNTKNWIIIAHVVVILCIIFVIIKSSDIKTVYSADNILVQNAAQKMAKDCVSGDREKCYEASFKSLINTYNFSFAEQTLYRLQDLDPMTKSCHVLAHALSRDAVRKNPSDWLSLFDSVDVNACGSGFLHGVLEAHLGDDPNTKFDGELSEKVCNRGTDDYRKRMCTHFMGHFFIVNTNDHVELAVPYCDGVSQNLKFDCLDGVFMEHNQKIALDDHKLASLPDYTPEYAKSLQDVCLSQNGIAGSACWTEMAEVYAKTFGYNADKIYSHCLAGKEYSQSCYGKGQTILSTYPLELSPKELTDICKFYPTENGAKGCMSNVISSLMYYSPKFTSRGLTMCENISKYGEWCAKELGQKLALMVPSVDDRRLFCQSAKDEKYKNLCVQAN